MSFYKSAIKAAKEREYIFFDFWDTIVHRRVHPDTIKQIVACEMAGDNKKELYEIRLYAEEYCAKTIGDFDYDEMEQVMNQCLANRGIEGIGSFKRKELDIEIQNAYLDKETYTLISELKENGKKLFVVSDFYMGSDSLQEILDSLGCGDFFDRIFVSCDCRRSKGSGKIYKHVLNELRISANECLMIGDNYRTDYKRARACGIQAIHRNFKIESPRLTKEYIEKELLRIEKGQVKNLFDSYAFSLFLFTSKLYNEIHQKHIRDIVFITREGKYLKKLFDNYARFMNDTSVHTHYWYVSRRSTYLPSLKEAEKEKYDLRFQIQYYSMADFLRNLSFDDEEIERLRQSLGFSDANLEISNFKESEEFEKIRSSEIFKEIFEKKRQYSNSLLLKYINQSGIDYRKNGLFIADIGWRGTVQNNLYNLFKQEIEVKGFYLGLLQATACSIKNRKVGLLFNYPPPTSKYVRQFDFNRDLYEDILHADHPCTIGYSEEEGIIKPVFDRNEDPVLINNAKKIQNRIFPIFMMLGDLFKQTVYDPDDLEKTFARISVESIHKCTLKDINTYREMTDAHTDNYMMQKTYKELKERCSVRDLIRGSIKRKGYRSFIRTAISGEHYLENCVYLKKAKVGWLIPTYLKILYLIEKRELKKTTRNES